MILDSGFRIAASGMSAQRTRMDVIANNIANAETTVTPEGGPYRRRSVLFSEIASHAFGDKQKAGGVQVTGIVREMNNDKAFTRVYDPGHPQADADGWVLRPNIHVMAEMVNLMEATREYDANVTMLNNMRQVTTKALDIGRV